MSKFVHYSLFIVHCLRLTAGEELTAYCPLSLQSLISQLPNYQLPNYQLLPSYPVQLPQRQLHSFIAQKGQAGAGAAQLVQV